MTSKRARGPLLSALLLAAVTASSCSVGDRSPAGAGEAPVRDAGAGRLGALSRIAEARGDLGRPGRHEVSSGRHGRALLTVPDAAARGPVPLVLVLHGAGGDAESGMRVLGEAADAAGVAVLAPASRRRTWDVVSGGFGPDVAAIDALLRRVSGAVPVDATRTAIAGFSDGASYALSLGLTNGDRFARIIAFSPGFAAPGERRGRPPVFVSHGRQDRVLPIDRTSRQLVPALRRAGHTVTYREFGGGHTVPPAMVAAALTELLGREVPITERGS